jgi:adenylate kinase family enzyme
MSSPPSPFPYRRIAVVGATGSGKTTLATELAARLHIPHIELDALYWQPDWVEADWDEMRRRVDELTRLPAWVTDGNYNFCRDLIWERAEAVIWLDFPLALCLWRLWRRTWARIFSREPLWGTNVERFWPQFFSRDSIFYWALRTFGERRRRYTALFASGAYPHLALHRFRSPREVEGWMRAWEGGGDREIGG